MEFDFLLLQAASSGGRVLCHNIFFDNQSIKLMMKLMVMVMVMVMVKLMVMMMVMLEAVFFVRQSGSGTSGNFVHPGSLQRRG